MINLQFGKTYLTCLLWYCLNTQSYDSSHNRCAGRLAEGRWVTLRSRTSSCPQKVPSHHPPFPKSLIPPTLGITEGPAVFPSRNLTYAQFRSNWNEIRIISCNKYSVASLAFPNNPRVFAGFSAIRFGKADFASLTLVQKRPSPRAVQNVVHACTSGGLLINSCMVLNCLQTSPKCCS